MAVNSGLRTKQLYDKECIQQQTDFLPPVLTKEILYSIQCGNDTYASESRRSVSQLF